MKKKLTILVAMIALMMTTFAAPGIAKVKFDNDRSNGGGFFIGGGGNGFNVNDNRGVSFEVGDTENESGNIETENSFSIEGNNNNACLGQLQFGQTGNFTNQQSAGQFFSAADDLEFEGGEIEFAPENETACDQAVQQSSAASSL